MSHFTRVRTKLRDRQTILKVLADMGFTPAPDDAPGGAVVVRGWAGDRRKAEFKVSRGEYDVGFVAGQDGFDAVGDFSMMRLDEGTFVRDLTRRYALQTVRTQAAARGFQVVEEQQQSDGSVKVVVERWT